MTCRDRRQPRSLAPTPLEAEAGVGLLHVERPQGTQGLAVSPPDPPNSGFGHSSPPMQPRRGGSHPRVTTSLGRYSPPPSRQPPKRPAVVVRHQFDSASRHQSFGGCEPRIRRRQRPASNTRTILPTRRTRLQLSLLRSEQSRMKSLLISHVEPATNAATH